MKRIITTMLLFTLLAGAHSTLFAAELLDVKPVVTGNVVAIEISADIPMTYTYYKVPGQARAVVDIAEADPEKVEPLIVVNKGAISSISVDKAQISGIIISRIIFNLVSETNISVSAAPDRKMLTVTFGGSAAGGSAEIKPEPKLAPPAPAAEVKPPASTPEPPAATALKEEDPLELDEPAVKSAPLAATAVAAATAATAASVATSLPALPVVTRIPKLEPVVPSTVQTGGRQALTIKDITTGATYIEIRANQPVGDYKASRISSPDRLIIDIAGAKVQQKPKSIPINKFGVSKARIGTSPKSIRIVFDSGKVGFPAYSISSIEDGLRINFK